MEKRLISERKYDGYVVRKEAFDNTEYGGSGETIIRSAYTVDGFYIGNAATARYLVGKMGIKPEPRTENSGCCSIGYCEKENKWYGWSHRAICGFGIGDRIYDSNYGDDETPIVSHGSIIIKNMVDAKIAASNFAQDIS